MTEPTETVDDVLAEIRAFPEAAGIRALQVWADRIERARERETSHAEMTLQMLVAAGFVDEAKVSEAREIAVRTNPAKASGSAPDGLAAVQAKLVAAQNCNYFAVQTLIEEALGLIGQMARSTATPPASAPEVTEFPKKVTKTVCDGCPNLRAKRWKDHLDNDETDSGTEATCAQAHRHISMYWREGDATPPWCPMTAALTEKSHE